MPEPTHVQRLSKLADVLRHETAKRWTETIGSKRAGATARVVEVRDDGFTWDAEGSFAPQFVPWRWAEIELVENLPRWDGNVSLGKAEA